MRTTLLAFIPLSLVALEAGGPAQSGRGVAAQFAVTHAFFDQALVGKRVVDLPNRVHQTTASLGAAYRLPETPVTVDMRTALGRMTGSDGGNTTDLLDSSVGVSWQVPGTTPWTLRPRIGVILPGNYEVLDADAFGVGAGGAEASLAVSRSLGLPGLQITADLGYRVMGEEAPDRVVGAIGMLQRWTVVEIGVAYRHDQSLSGHDFGEGSSQGVRRIAGFGEVSAATPLSENTIGRLAVAKAVQGRNKAEKSQISLIIDHRF